MTGLLTMVAAGALIVAFAIGTFISLQFPETVRPQVAQPIEIEDPDAPPEREYLRLRHAITANFPDLGGVLRIEIAIAIDDDANRSVMSEFEDNPAFTVAPLAEVLLSLGETVSPEGGFAELRTLIPAAFADNLNDRFEAMGDGRPVLEILIMQYSIGG